MRLHGKKSGSRAKRINVIGGLKVTKGALGVSYFQGRRLLQKVIRFPCFQLGLFFLTQSGDS